MSLTTNLKAYWPWWSAILFLLAYELVALVTPAETLSSMVWQAQARFAGLALIVFIVCGVLIWHFFFQKRS
jgi:hypothetical protein